MALVLVDDVGAVRVLTLAHDKPTNPFSMEMKAAVMAAFREADDDDRVSAIVLTGGVDRSFSAGGDFNEVRQISGDVEVDAWIDRVTDLYLSALDISKPTVAAIDNYAIGIGFQLAMMFDWRIMSTRASFMMPELEHGIGASMAAAILTATCGYDMARHVIMSCQPISPSSALSIRMVDEVTERELLVDRAIQRAERLGSYPESCFGVTKRALTNTIRTVLEDTRQQSKIVHRAAFRAKSMHGHLDRVLHRDGSVAAGS